MDHNQAASYTWVFTGDTLTAGHQAESIRRLADTLGMTIVREYEDEEYGSGPGGRPQFHRMMDEARSESRPFGTVTSYDRWPFAAGAADPWKYVRELRDAGVELLCVSGQAAKERPGGPGPGVPAEEGGLRAQGPAQADPPATWPPTQPSYRAEQPASPNTPPLPHGAASPHRRDGQPRHPRPARTPGPSLPSGPGRLIRRSGRRSRPCRRTAQAEATSTRPRKSG